MSGVAGANIANAAGRPIQAGTPWSAAVVQFPIGDYVESPIETRAAADTNYIGLGVTQAYVTNVVGEGSVATGPTIAPQPNFIVPDNDNDVRGGTSQWVRASGTITEGGLCTVTAGAVAADVAGLHVCNVVGGVVAGQFFWATVVADV